MERPPGNRDPKLRSLNSCDGRGGSLSNGVVSDSNSTQDPTDLGSHGPDSAGSPTRRYSIWVGIALVVIALFSLFHRWGRSAEPNWGGLGVSEWLELHEEASCKSGRIDGFTASWMEPTPDLMNAVRSMGTSAIPRLVEIGLSPAPRERRRAILYWLDERAPWTEPIFTRGVRRWVGGGELLPPLARAVIGELRPSAADLHPWVTKQLSSPYALLMLSDVSEDREAAAAILNSQSARFDRLVLANAAGALGQAGAAAIPALVRCLTDDKQVGPYAFECLCRLGPAAADCVPELRAFFDQQCRADYRIRLALLAANVDPGTFWAEPELREELRSSDPMWVGPALRTLKEWPCLSSRFESELRWISMTGEGLFDVDAIVKWQRSEWFRSVSGIPNAGAEAQSVTDLARLAEDLLKCRDQ